jgi:hypothetical protein
MEEDKELEQQQPLDARSNSSSNSDYEVESDVTPRIIPPPTTLMSRQEEKTDEVASTPPSRVETPANDGFDGPIGGMTQANPSNPMPEDIEEARNLYKKSCGDRKLVAGLYYYLINFHWLRDFHHFIEGTEGKRPGPIDNSDLVVGNSLQHNISERVDYEILSAETWQLLADWFGGGPQIRRRAYNISSTVMLDVSGVDLRFKRSGDMNAPEVPGNFAKWETVGGMTRTMCKIMGLDHKEVKVWDFYNQKPYNVLSELSATIQNVNLLQGQLVLFEERDPKTGEFKIPLPDRLLYNSSSGMSGGGSSSFSMENTLQSSVPPQSTGLVGLCNLGNTCFMNSMLQCLNNTPPVREYFVSGAFKTDINRDNPLGMKGKLAESFADLLEAMNGKRGTGNLVAPRGFKAAIAQFKPEFSGYNQHDSQELLAFLLDGLHEDLNRVKQKPYTSTVESNGRPEHVVAAEALEVYKKRNDSYISDLFTGQFRSTVCCPSCDHVSVTFDPYMCVQLPLSKENTPMQVFEVQLVNPVTWQVEQGKPIRAMVPKKDPSFALRAKVAEAAGLHVEHVIVAQVWHHKVCNLVYDNRNLDRLLGADKLFAFVDENAQRSLMQSISTKPVLSFTLMLITSKRISRWASPFS